MNIRFTGYSHRDKTVFGLRKALDIVGFGKCKQCPDLLSGQPVGENRKINPQLLNDPTVGEIVIFQSYDFLLMLTVSSTMSVLSKLDSSESVTAMKRSTDSNGSP